MNHTTNETEIPEIEIDGVDIIFIPAPAGFKALSMKYIDTGEMFIFINSKLPASQRDELMNQHLTSIRGDLNA